MIETSLSLAILVSSASRAAGGMFNSVRRGAIALVEAGLCISVYAPRDEFSDEDLPEWQPLRPELFDTRGPRALALASGLDSALNARKHDVLHLHGLWQYSSVQTRSWQRRTGRPVMISPRGMLEPWALKNSGWKKRVARLIFEDANLNAASCLHALNQSEANAMRNLGLLNPIAVIPNGADLPAEGETHERPAWLPDDGRKLLLFLGRLHPKKGLRELIAAWAELKRSAPATAAKWRVVIAGWDDGGHAPMLSRDVAAHDLADDIMMPGPAYGAVKAALLSEAAAFILPSHSEGLPMAVLESWAYNCPVFMTAACNLSEGFAAGAAVEISTNSAEMANTLAAHLIDTGLSKRGLCGQDLVATRFGWDRIARDHADVYRWMVHGGEPPASVQLA